MKLNVNKDGDNKWSASLGISPERNEELSQICYSALNDNKNDFDAVVSAVEQMDTLEEVVYIVYQMGSIIADHNKDKNPLQALLSRLSARASERNEDGEAPDTFKNHF